MGGLVIIVGEGGCAEVVRLMGWGSDPKGWAIESRMRVEENCHYWKG